MANSKTTVCINFSSSLEHLEIVKVNEKNGEIERVGSAPFFSYDPIGRSLTDPAEAAGAIKALYQSHQIPLSTPSVLVVPGFYTREISLPTDFNEEETRIGLVSEAERFFMFKKREPQVDWMQMDREGQLFFSAYPKDELEKYANLFRKNGIPLVGVELNYLAILRGLVATGAISQQIDKGEDWLLMLVTDSVFFMGLFRGVRLLRFSEAPLSVSSSDEQSIIMEIKQDVDAQLAGQSFTRGILVNNTTRVSSQKLVDMLGLYQELMVINQNHQTLRSLGKSDGALPCSLEAIGGVFYNDYPELPAMNFSPQSTGEVAVVDNLRQTLKRLLVTGNTGLLILIMVITGMLHLGNLNKAEELATLKEEIKYSGKRALGLSLSKVSRQWFIRESLKNNIALNNLVIEAGTKLPQEMWLDNLVVDLMVAPGKQVVEMEGGAKQPGPVNEFLIQLNKTLKRDDLEVGKAELKTTEDGQSYYEWVIHTQGVLPQNYGGESPEGPYQPYGGTENKSPLFGGSL